MAISFGFEVFLFYIMDILCSVTHFTFILLQYFYQKIQHKINVQEMKMSGMNVILPKDLYQPVFSFGHCFATYYCDIVYITLVHENILIVVVFFLVSLYQYNNILLFAILTVSQCRVVGRICHPSHILHPYYKSLL